MLDYTEYTKIFISLFAILDPVGMIPIIIAFTLELTPAQRARIGRMASFSVSLILLIALLMGELLLEFFGISMHSFRVAGGILLMLMAIPMLFGNRDQPGPDDNNDEATTSIAFVPLATPLLAGPGAISTIILDAHKGHGVGHYTVMASEIVLMGFVVWLTFLVAPWVSQRMGRIGSDVFSRMMGLIIAAISVEFIATGLRGLFPALG